MFQKVGIDIPQWAKDAGHNGSVYYIVSVTVDGHASDIKLSESSGSSAIDESALDRLKSARFLPATDSAGKPAAGSARIRLEYHQWDDESPGGGLDDYRCGQLTREYNWFAQTHHGKNRRIFPLQNYYVGWEMLKNREDIPLRDRPAIEAQRKKYEKRWQDVLEDCRKTPDRLLLDRVEDPKGFRGLAESF
ncbi:MAG: TonB family protein [Sphingomonadaceae bacterium]|nr:TonB family protein [Sphingomonadaceae bacterium]